MDRVAVGRVLTLGDCARELAVLVQEDGLQLAVRYTNDLGCRVSR